MSEREAPVKKRAEAGYQWLIEDNHPPETVAEKKEQARQRKKLTSKAEGVGDWEKGLTEQGREMLPNLHLPELLVHHGGATLTRYQTDTNAFNGSMRLAMNSLGRAKDLAAAGAPAEPEAVSAKLKHGMEKKAHSETAETAFNLWSDQHSEIDETFELSLAEKEQLQSALEKLRSARTYLVERQKKAEKARLTEEKAKIDEAVDVAVEILEITLDVYKMAYGSGKELLKEPDKIPGKAKEFL